MIIDTIHLKLTKLDLPEADFMKIGHTLTNKKVSYDSNDEIIKIEGYLNNMYIIATNYHIIIRNSLCKYIFENNYTPMNLKDVEFGIKKLSKNLNLPIEKATITRLDIAYDISLKYKSSLYLNNMGNARGYNRLEQTHGIYYRNNERMLAIYDKPKELKNKKLPIPTNFTDQNILRFELRFIKKVSKQFNKKNLIANYLYDKNFIEHLKNRWKKEFNKINISNRALNNLICKGVKEFQNILALMTVNKKGEAYWINEINSFQRSGIINKKQTQRLRDYIRNLCKKKLPGISTSLADELKMKFKF